MHQLKKDTLRPVKKNFMNRELNEAIMVRSKVCNKFLKLKPEENLSVNIITNFWKTVCRLFYPQKF